MQYFYHNIIKNHVNIFGNVFNNIYIKRTNIGEELIKEIKVPIAYANKDSLYQMVLRRGDDPDNIEDNIQITLPRLAFNLKGIRYEPQRKLNRIHEYIESDENYDVNTVFTQTPYKLYFNLYILGNKIDDTNQIFEQIVPVFTPDIKISCDYDFNDIRLTIDESLLLLGSNYEDFNSSDFNEQERRLWILEFEMDCSFFNIINNKVLVREIICGFGLTSESANNIILESTSIYYNSNNILTIE